MIWPMPLPHTCHTTMPPSAFSRGLPTRNLPVHHLPAALLPVPTARPPAACLPSACGLPSLSPTTCLRLIYPPALRHHPLQLTCPPAAPHHPLWLAHSQLAPPTSHPWLARLPLTPLLRLPPPGLPHCSLALQELAANP